MKTRFFMKLCLFSLLVWCVSSCKSDNGDSVRPIALECMYTHLTDMTNMLDTAKIGTSDGPIGKCPEPAKSCRRTANRYF